jgi:hypothetical protein
MYFIAYFLPWFYYKFFKCFQFSSWFTIYHIFFYNSSLFFWFLIFFPLALLLVF